MTLSSHQVSLTVTVVSICSMKANDVPLPHQGGIGPTPDDITYQSIAKAFNADPLEYHDETLRRMAENLKARRRDQGEVTEDVSRHHHTLL